MTKEKISSWEILNKVPYKHLVEKKGKLSYVSWASGWSVVKEHFPDAYFDKKVFTQPDGSQLPYMKDEQGNTYVAVTLFLYEDPAPGDEVSEIFPVTDYQNKSIKNPTSNDVSNAFQRALAKCFAYFGLGIHLYTGEDIPSEEKDSSQSERELPESTSNKTEMWQEYSLARQDDIQEIVNRYTDGKANAGECINELNLLWDVVAKPLSELCETEAPAIATELRTHFKMAREELAPSNPDQ